MPNNTVSNFDNVEIEMVIFSSYLCAVFSTLSSFSEAHSGWSGQALKAFLNEQRFVLFEKLIAPILNNGNQVWVFVRVHVLK